MKLVGASDSEEFESHHARDDHEEAQKPLPGSRIVKEENPDRDRDGGAKPRPDRIGRADRNVSLREVEKPEFCSVLY